MASHSRLVTQLLFLPRKMTKSHLTAWQPNFPDCHHHDAWVYDNVRRLGHIHTYTGTIPFPICPSVSPPTWGSRGSLWGSFQVVVRLIYFGRKLLERALYRTICIWTFCSSSDPMYWILESLPFVFYKDPSNPRWCHQSNQKFGWPYQKKSRPISLLHLPNWSDICTFLRG